MNRLRLTWHTARCLLLTVFSFSVLEVRIQHSILCIHSTDSIPSHSFNNPQLSYCIVHWAKEKKCKVIAGFWKAFPPEDSAFETATWLHLQQRAWLANREGELTGGMYLQHIRYSLWMHRTINTSAAALEAIAMSFLLRTPYTSSSDHRQRMWRVARKDGDFFA